MGKRALTALIIFISIAVLSVSFIFAFFFQKVEIDDNERTFGEVFVVSPVYFNNVSIGGQYIETLDSYSKEGIYYVNISHLDDPYHINKLRIDFEIDSNIDTYFRVKIVDLLSIVYVKADGATVELSVPMTEPIEYNIDFDDWYYGENDDWYYYKNIVNDTSGTISFITEGLQYPLYPPEYVIQLGIIIEAVQAVRGPAENWKLPKRPWDGGDWT